MAETDAITTILRRDPRYRREAYEFVQEALSLSHRAAGRRRHVSGAELLAAFRDLARDAFGPLAATVLAEWGLRTTEDVGRVVFNLVEADEMGATEDDDIGDFRDVYAFADVFPTDAGPVRVRRASEEE